MPSHENDESQPKSSNAKDKCNQTGESVRDGAKLGKLRADRPLVPRDGAGNSNDDAGSNETVKSSNARKTSESTPVPNGYPCEQVLTLLLL
jgi:hypothetical protein